MATHAMPTPHPRLEPVIALLHRPVTWLWEHSVVLLSACTLAGAGLVYALEATIR